ncbi:hypothetical protein G9A89_014191 [Geosiphon pyriformis]|nr:hypothetical protein G9A89_014191 [Geosiphon pyriformis]
MTKNTPVPVVELTPNPTFDLKIAEDYSSRHTQYPHINDPMFVPRRKAIHNFYEFQKKCLELSADYYQGIANLLRETDVSLFFSPTNQGESLSFINETNHMILSNMINTNPSEAGGGGGGGGGTVTAGFAEPISNKNKRKEREFESEDSDGSENKKSTRNRRAPRQLWTEEEVEKLKNAHDKHNGDWELVIKEFEPERTRIQIFQKARQIGLRAVESGRLIDPVKPTGASQDKGERPQSENDGIEFENPPQGSEHFGTSGGIQDANWPEEDGADGQDEDGNSVSGEEDE